MHESWFWPEPPPHGVHEVVPGYLATADGSRCFNVRPKCDFKESWTSLRAWRKRAAQTLVQQSLEHEQWMLAMAEHGATMSAIQEMSRASRKSRLALKLLEKAEPRKFVSPHDVDA